MLFNGDRPNRPPEVGHTLNLTGSSVTKAEVVYTINPKRMGKLLALIVSMPKISNE